MNDQAHLFVKLKLCVCDHLISCFYILDTLHKISALEGELARLKAQIAIYALSESQGLSVPAAPPPPPPPPPTSQVWLYSNNHKEDGMHHTYQRNFKTRTINSSFLISA